MGPAAPLRLIRALSLDIVAGGVAGAAFAAHLTGAALPEAFWQVLPAAIWVVYTLDHLIDARRVGPRAANDRHAFHARHALPLSLAVAVVAAFAATRVPALPPPLLAPGVALAAAVTLYLGALQRGLPAWLPPELPVAAIYTLGLWIGPLALAGQTGPAVLVALAVHGALALGYLLAYAWFEAPMDTADGVPSMARMLGRERLARLIAALSALAAAASLAAAWVAGPGRAPSFLALAAAAIVPWAMVRVAPALEPFDRYRHAEWTLLVLLAPALFARAG